MGAQRRALPGADSPVALQGAWLSVPTAYPSFLEKEPHHPRTEALSVLTGRVERAVSPTARPKHQRGLPKY